MIGLKNMFFFAKIKKGFILGIFLESDLWTPPPCIKNVQKKFLTILDNKINLNQNFFFNMSAVWTVAAAQVRTPHVLAAAKGIVAAAQVRLS